MNSKISNIMNMNERDPEKLSKAELIKMLLKQKKKKSKKVRNHEDLFDNDAFKDEVSQPVPPPPPIKEHTTNVPSLKVKELNRALKGHAKSYGIELQDNLNPLNHFTKTIVLVESHLEDLLKTMKGFKFIETLEVTLKRKQLIQKLESA